MTLGLLDSLMAGASGCLASKTEKSGARFA